MLGSLLPFSKVADGRLHQLCEKMMKRESWKVLPEYVVGNACHIPTPVHAFRLGERVLRHDGHTTHSSTSANHNSSSSATVRIKRDDLTESLIGGNKVRKLQYLLADALSPHSTCSLLQPPGAVKAQHVVTIGGVQSNHCRATTLLARRLGLTPHVVLRVPDEFVQDDKVTLPREANVFLQQAVGVNVFYVTKSQYREHGQQKLLAMATEKLLADSNTDGGGGVYPIPVGGSSALAAFGYAQCLLELQEQTPDATRLVFACGSGGTAAGLALGKLLLGWDALALHAVCVCDSKAYFLEHVTESLQEIGVDVNESDVEKLVTFDERFKGTYVDHPSASTDTELALLADLAESTGLMLDPCYTIKAFRGMLATTHEGEGESFHLKNTVFLNTGVPFTTQVSADRLLDEGHLQAFQCDPLL